MTSIYIYMCVCVCLCVCVFWFAALAPELGSSCAKNVPQLGSGDTRIVAVSPRSGCHLMTSLILFLQDVILLIYFST